MIALMTTGLVLLPIVAVSVVLVWAESRARRRETIVAEPRLTSALLTARDDEVSREPVAAGPLNPSLSPLLPARAPARFSARLATRL
jgi:hypothetical protein